MIPHPTHRTPTSRRHPFRLSSWRGKPDVVVAGPLPTTRVTATQVRALCDDLTRQGITQVFTIALTPPEQQPFTDAGFRHHEHLHLLKHTLGAVPAPPGVHHPVKRARRSDRDRVLTVDNLAFDDFWSFDNQALTDARSATPTSRFRVATAAGTRSGVVGYAITGRARRTCYLQRLAVDPRHQRHGIGAALVCDALHWGNRRRADCMFVNTQERNTAALRLYEALGFTQQPNGLDVLGWTP